MQWLNSRIFYKMLHLRYSTAHWIRFHFKIYQSCEYTRVLTMSGLHKVLTVLWICLGFWISKVLNMLELHIFLKKRKRYIIDTWQCPEYSSGSKYTRIPNVLDKVLNLTKCCAIDAWQDCEYFSGSEGF